MVRGERFAEDDQLEVIRARVAAQEGDPASAPGIVDHSAQIAEMLSRGMKPAEIWARLSGESLPNRPLSSAEIVDTLRLEAWLDELDATEAAAAAREKAEVSSTG